MITPRTTRLLRVSGLPAFQRAIATAACSPDPARTRATVVIVPSRAAAAEFRRTLENLLLAPPACNLPGAHTRDGAGAIVLPDLVTRDDWYARLHEGLPEAPPRLTGFEREVLLAAACRDAIAEGAAPPFTIRPGLVLETLGLYDELRRRDQTLDRFEALLTEELEPQVAIDRGAERALRQTRFLVAAFRAYECRVDRSGGVDEHRLRTLLVRTPATRPLKHVIVTVGDRASEGGLWPADFDLLARLPLLEELDVIATDAMLAAGFEERLHDLLPGIEEARIETGEARTPASLVAPGEGDGLFFVSRDREEELIGIARRLKRRRRGETTHPEATLERTAVVFKRPLPYLYLAREVFRSARIPCQMLDMLPLAAEPYAAALDLVFSFVTSGFTRSAAVALLRSPHFVFETADRALDARAIAAFDYLLSEAGYLGDLEMLRRLAAEWGRPADGQGGHATMRGEAAAAASAAAAAAAELEPLTRPAPASGHLAAILEFVRRHERLPAPGDPSQARHLRARAAILSALETLRTACQQHDDPVCGLSDIVGVLRRWIEGETFAPAPGGGGLRLVDAAAARYGDFDELYLVGVIEGDWPERSKRNIFYSPYLLGKLGWPPDSDRLAAARAAFRDLLHLPARSLLISTCTLEDEAIVEPASLLDELHRVSLPIVREGADDRARVFVREALAMSPVRADVLTGEAALWLAIRGARTPQTEARFHGDAGARRAQVYSVGAIERYVECPFKFFAEHVLKLREDPDDDHVMSPRARGRFIHEVFQAFFETWHRQGRGTITADRLDEARALFEDVAAPRLAMLPAAEANLERTRLMGSPVAVGLAEAVFRMEAERPTEVVERLLEYPLEGDFELAGEQGPRRVALRGIADRIDLLADGTLRILDYKTGRVPNPSRALQLPIYSLCATAQLAGYDERRWTLGEAAYIALGGPRAVVPMAYRNVERTLAEAQLRLLAAVDGIERGEFPPRPAEPFLCTYCPYSGVCRKDYVGDE